MPISNKKTGSILLIEGLDNSKPAEYISDKACTESFNFEVDEGLLKKRCGISVIDEVVGGTGLEIMAGREFLREGVAYNVRVGLDKTEVYDTTNTEWDDITKDATDWTGDTDDIFDTAIPLLTGMPILCITNGKDAIQKWTGTGLCVDLGGTPPIAKFIQEYKTYLICANIQGGTVYPQRVQWCDTAAPETWDSGNAGAVDLVEDGEDITGLNVFGNYICVHKKSSINLGYGVSSDNIFQFDRRSTGVGTIANNSIVNLPTGEQIFVAKDGIRIFNGITAPLIDSPINDEIRNSLNANKAHKSYGLLITEKDEVWLGIPIGSEEYGTTIYKYNYKNKVLYKDSRTNATAMWRGASTNALAWDDFDESITWDDVEYRWDDISFSTDSDQINIGTTTGFVYKVDTSVLTDAGTNVDAYWDSKDFQDAQDNICRWKGLELWATGGSVKVYYSIDEGTTWVEASNSPVALTDQMPSYTSPLMIYFDTISTKLRIRFKNDSAETLNIKQFIVQYSVTGHRR